MWSGPVQKVHPDSAVADDGVSRHATLWMNCTLGDGADMFLRVRQDDKREEEDA